MKVPLPSLNHLHTFIQGYFEGNTLWRLTGITQFSEHLAAVSDTCEVLLFSRWPTTGSYKLGLSTSLTSVVPTQAPELFNGTRVDEKCDVFSLGEWVLSFL